MSHSQTIEDKQIKNVSNVGIQSKVVEYQILSNSSNSFFEFKNAFVGNYSQEFFPKNIIEQPQKKSSRREIIEFYSKIKYIRKKYNIKKSRKNHIDSLVKKAKSKFLKGIYEGLKFCLNSYIYDNSCF